LVRPVRWFEGHNVPLPAWLRFLDSVARDG